MEIHYISLRPLIVKTQFHLYDDGKEEKNEIVSNQCKSPKQKSALRYYFLSFFRSLCLFVQNICVTCIRCNVARYKILTYFRAQTNQINAMKRTCAFSQCQTVFRLISINIRYHFHPLTLSLHSMWDGEGWKFCCFFFHPKINKLFRLHCSIVCVCV